MPQVITYSWKNISLCFFDEAAKGIDQSCEARVESIDAFIWASENHSEQA